MKDILIVYPRDHKSFIKKLVSRLESDNFTCYVAPRDFRQDDKESVTRFLESSGILLLVMDKTSASNAEMRTALQIALESQKEIIPFVIEKTEQGLYSDYFFHALSWVDAYEDSFDDAYDLLKEAIAGLTGERKTRDKRPAKKNQSQTKLKPLHYIIAVIVFGFLGYFIYQGLSNNHDSNLIGQWRVSDYQDNMPRSSQDSIMMIQGLMNLKSNARVSFHDDHTFERRGFTPEPQKGKWSLNPDKTVLYLEPIGESKKDIVNIEKLTENELVIFVNEVIDSLNVTTKIYFSKLTN